jgi:RNA polymerase sigma-70 factor (ECF subfamily)
VVTKPSADTEFRSVYDETYAEVFAYCLRRASLEDAKDATADVYLVLWRRFDGLSFENGVLPWLYGTARKALANQRRRPLLSCSWCLVQPRY